MTDLLAMWALVAVGLIAWGAVSLVLSLSAAGMSGRRKADPGPDAYATAGDRDRDRYRSGGDSGSLIDPGRLPGRVARPRKPPHVDPRRNRRR